MTNFNDFITGTAKEIGVPQEKIGEAAGGLMGMLKTKVASGDFSALMEAMPGAAGFQSASAGGGGGGIAGSIMGAATNLLGGKAGGAMAIMSIFEKADLNTGQAGSFVKMFVDFATKQAGGDLVSKILDQVPDLKGLLGK